MRTTLKQVAERAGVSAMAASVVLNNTGINVTVTPETAERIRRVASELNYRSNRLAQSLRSRRTGSIALVFQHFDRLAPKQPYHIDMMNGVMSALFPRDYTLSLCPRLNLMGEANAVSDGRFDGVLWCRPELSGVHLEELQNAKCPIVVLHCPPGVLPGLTTFCADNPQAMRLVVAHLYNLGHRRIAFVIDSVTIQAVEGIDRRDGFFAAAASYPDVFAGITLADEVEASASIYTGGKGPFTALVCFGDNLGGKVLEWLSQAGVSVPDEVSVTGFDSSIFCDATHPPLTSISQPVEKIAKEATNYLLDNVDDYVKTGEMPLAKSFVYECGLDVRKSTGPPIEV